MTQHMALVNYLQALTLLHEFQTKVEAGWEPVDILDGYDTPKLLLFYTAVRQVALVIPVMEEGTRLVLEERGADMSTFRTRTAAGFATALTPELLAMASRVRHRPRPS